MKIIFRNLARHTTQETLLALFQKHGRVQSCTLVMDAVTGDSKGFGFANMPVAGEAKAAIRALNGMELDGSRIRVKKATEPQKPAVAKTGTEQSAQAVTDVDVRYAEPARPRRLKKDGTPLGPPTFRKKKGK